MAFWAFKSQKFEKVYETKNKNHAILHIYAKKIVTFSGRYMYLGSRKHCSPLKTVGIIGTLKFSESLKPCCRKN